MTPKIPVKLCPAKQRWAFLIISALCLILRQFSDRYRSKSGQIASIKSSVTY